MPGQIVQCPKCGARLYFATDRAGSTIPCPDCGTQVGIPSEPQRGEERAAVPAEDGSVPEGREPHRAPLRAEWVGPLAWSACGAATLGLGVAAAVAVHSGARGLVFGLGAIAVFCVQLRFWKPSRAASFVLPLLMAVAGVLTGSVAVGTWVSASSAPGPQRAARDRAEPAPEAQGGPTEAPPAVPEAPPAALTPTETPAPAVASGAEP